MGSSLRGTVSSIEVKSTCNNSPGPLQIKGFIGATGGAASFPTATTLFNAVSEVSSHGWSPEELLHEGGRATLTLMSCLMMTTIQGSAPMPLRNDELEHDLISLSLPSLTV